jgi:hypothetical protein
LDESAELIHRQEAAPAGGAPSPAHAAVSITTTAATLDRRARLLSTTATEPARARAVTATDCQIVLIAIVLFLSSQCHARDRWGRFASETHASAE